MKIGVWVNDKREKETHPHLKASKPVEMPDGSFQWLSMWFTAGTKGNAKEAEIEAQIEKFLAYLKKHCGTSPVLTMSFSPAEARNDGGTRKSANYDDDAPF